MHMERKYNPIIEGIVLYTYGKSIERDVLYRSCNLSPEYMFPVPLLKKKIKAEEHIK